MSASARSRIARWSFSVLVLGLAGVPRARHSAAGHGFEVRTVSNRADLISGGDVLVEVSVPASVALDRVVVTVDGRDVTASLTADPGSRRLRGLVDGLREGGNEIAAGFRMQTRFGPWVWNRTVTTERLTVTNHPIGGPVFSGPQVQPWVCATPTAQPGDATTPHTNASGLSTPAVDAQCNIATELRWWYKPTGAPATCAGIAGANPCFKPYDVQNPPADVATTTTDRGVTVPFVVRVERGTMNRGIHDVAVLADPAGPVTPAWNGKILWSFGASTGSPRRQFAPQSTWYSTNPAASNDEALARGFMTAAASLTDQQLNSNLTVSAETVMMLKEHIAERYGPIRYVMGQGCSGGSITQNVIASAYPGLLDGLQISCTYPDAITTATEVGDCVMLNTFFSTPEWAAITAGLTPEEVNAKRAAIAGHQDQRGCPAWNAAFSHANLPGFIPNRAPAPSPWTPPAGPRADVPNNCLLPQAMVYDAATNPGGIRCGGPEHVVSIYGRADDPAFPNRAAITRDNVGVEYGLGALVAGAITPEEFVTLNERIGATDPDGAPTAQRASADVSALRTAYRSGLLADGRTLAKVPIIDLRGNDDAAIHHDWRSFELRERLDRATGGHGNHVMWRFGPALLPPAPTGLGRASFDLLDRWLTAVEADRSPAPIERKVLAAKPAEAYDFCWLSTDTAYASKVTDQAVCDADPVLRYFASPRQVAGGPRSEDVLKCHLRPLDRTRYGTVSFTDEQWQRLQATFAGGVCDWSRPGVGQQPSRPWSTYAGGPGGRPLGPAPGSR